MTRELKETIKVTVGQACHPGRFETWLDNKRRFRIVNPAAQLNAFFQAIDAAKNDKSDFVIFHELFMPRAYLNNYVRYVSEQNNFIIIGGLEYGPLSARDTDHDTPLTNEAFIAIPSEGTRREPGGTRYSTIITIPKLLPAEEEDCLIRSYNYSFQVNDKVYVFESPVVGNWAVLICSDFMNLPVQVLLQGKIHTLFVCSYNTDVNGFASIADTVQRLLMCNVVICNVGKYGSSLAFSPYRKDYKRQRLRIIGNDVNAAVTVELPLRSLDLAQKGAHLRDERNEQVFIRRPPDFGKFK